MSSAPSIIPITPQAAAADIPLAQPEARDPTVPPAESIERVTVGRENAARLVSVSVTTWDRLSSAGKTPKPIMIGCRRVWSVAEIREWIAAGAPDRKTWEAIREARDRRGRK